MTLTSRGKENTACWLCILYKPFHGHRSDLFITTKLWNEYHSPQDVHGALEASLRNLGLSYVDLYLMHWPFGFKRRDLVNFSPIHQDGKVS